MDNQYNKEVMIQLSNIKKMYKLGQIGGGTLQGDLQSWWARIRGKEDPNMQIGQTRRLVGQTFMALNGIDLTVYKGERLGIIGGNGAGKSTMLKLLSRVTAPTTGEIDLYGRVASMLEVGTGFNGEMTGRENVYLNGAILGMTKAEIDAKMENIIEFSEVRDFIDTPVKRYSSGMYVKLAFSVAAHLDSEIMIMDEVLAVGDVAFQKKCLNKMRSVATEEGRTVLYVSHNMNTIRTLCDRCIVLDQGKIIFDGNVEDAIKVYSSGKYIEQKTEYDVSSFKRNTACLGLCRINKIFIDNTTLNMGEKLKFKLEIISQQHMEEALLRFVLFNQSGETIGMAASQKYALNKGANAIQFELDTDYLSPGGYIADIILCEYKNKVYVKHDTVGEILAFEIEETVSFFDLRWNRQYWGNVKLPNLRVSIDS